MLHTKPNQAVYHDHKKAKANVKTTFILKRFDMIACENFLFISIRHLEFPLKHETD